MMWFFFIAFGVSYVAGPMILRLAAGLLMIPLLLLMIGLADWLQGGALFGGFTQLRQELKARMDAE